MTLKQKIECAYQNAAEGGYLVELEAMSAEELAEDMHRCGAEIEKYPIEDVVAAVREFLKHGSNRINDFHP